MRAPSRTMGPLEKLIHQRYPDQAVQYEAGALDRELASDKPDWRSLLDGIETFSRHYPALLLEGSSQAIEALGQGCLAAVERAPRTASSRGTSVLVGLVDDILAEVSRLGPERVKDGVPVMLKGLLDALAAFEDHGPIVSQLLSCGKRCLLIAEEGRPPQPWFALLGSLTRLLLVNTRERVAGEPVYDGRWSTQALSRELRSELLEPVSLERLERDARWLAELGDRLLAAGPDGEQACPAVVNVFLQLAEYDHRAERAEAWTRWFEAVAAGALQGFSPRSLLQLSRALAEWIASTSDLGFLRILAENLKKALPVVLDRLGVGSLEPDLHSWAEALVRRLEQEGSPDPAFVDLRLAARGLVSRQLDSGNPDWERAGLDLGLRLSLGPLTGRALDLDQALWLLALAGERPGMSAPCLAALVVPFALERQELFEQAGDATRFARALVALLDAGLLQQWPFALRALLRLTPLSPLQLAGASVQACLLGLSPHERGLAYLEDLRQRILGHRGPENLRDVEKVLRFWRGSDVASLGGLASAESLAALAASSKRHQQLRRVMDRLAEVAPGVKVCGLEEVGWLAELPETFYRPEVLMKLAGFEGIESRLIDQLAHLLCVYRHLREKFGADADDERLSALPDEDLLALADELLEQRSAARLQLERGAGSDDHGFQRLEPFARDLELVKCLDGLFEALALRSSLRPEACAVDPDGPARLLGRLLRHAALSGVALMDEAELAAMRDTRLRGEELRQLVSGLSVELAKAREARLEWLRPQVRVTLERLWSNPFAKPAEAFAAWCEAEQNRSAAAAGDELLELLGDELAAADGGLLLLEDFLRRMIG